jgi:transposase-like protein
MSTSGTRGPAGRRRRQWTAAERTACLRAFAATGQSVTAFCRERGVPRATLTLWRWTASASTAAARPADGAGTRFARVEVVTHPAPRAITSAAPPAPVELTLVLRTPDGVEAVVTGLDAAAVAVLRGVLAPSVAGAT